MKLHRWSLTRAIVALVLATGLWLFVRVST